MNRLGPQAGGDGLAARPFSLRRAPGGEGHQTEPLDRVAVARVITACVAGCFDRTAVVKTMWSAIASDTKPSRSSCWAMFAMPPGSTGLPRTSRLKPYRI